MKVKPFKCIIESLAYVSSKKNPEKPIFICNVTVKESGRGSAFDKTQHNLILYLTQEQFDNKILEKGDEIQVNDAKWKQVITYYTSYNKKVIEKADKSKLKVDSNGKVYFTEKIFSYKIQVKNSNWELFCKWYDVTYLKIIGKDIKLPLMSKKQFNLDIIDFVLEEKEFSELKDLNLTNQTVVGYYKKNKFAEENRGIACYMDENEDFILRIMKLNNEAKNE